MFVVVAPNSVARIQAIRFQLRRIKLDMLEWTNPATAALNEIRTAPLVRFSVLALNSIFFLVDPFAAIPSFLAITQSVDPARRKRMCSELKEGMRRPCCWPGCAHR